jgi:hypothetical protein
MGEGEGRQAVQGSSSWSAGWRNRAGTFTEEGVDPPLNRCVDPRPWSGAAGGGTRARGAAGAGDSRGRRGGGAAAGGSGVKGGPGRGATRQGCVPYACLRAPTPTWGCCEPRLSPRVGIQPGASWSHVAAHPRPPSCSGRGGAGARGAVRPLRRRPVRGLHRLSQREGETIGEKEGGGGGVKEGRRRGRTAVRGRGGVARHLGVTIRIVSNSIVYRIILSHPARRYVSVCAARAYGVST